MCSCLEDGLAVPPPYPVMRDEMWVRPAPGYEGFRDRIWAWAETACPHPDFRLVSGQVLRVGLRMAMAEHGGEEAYPALTAALPTLNGGSVSPVESARCLAEFDLLATRMREYDMVVLVDLADGRIVHLHDGDGVLGLPRNDLPGISIIGFDDTHRPHGLRMPAGAPVTVTWLDLDGVVRVRDDDGRVLFQTPEFTQRRDGDAWVFRDVATGAELRHLAPVGFGEDVSDGRFRGEIRPIDIDVYLVGVPLLRELFTASVRTGRLVWWY